MILADEITGELDSTSATLVLDLLAELHLTERVTIVVATHDPEVARRAERTVTLRDGAIVNDRGRRP